MNVQNIQIFISEQLALTVLASRLMLTLGNLFMFCSNVLIFPCSYTALCVKKGFGT